jgi:hypothetical protein
MKNLFYFLSISFALTSCVQLYNYQVYKTESSDVKLNKEKDLMVYEDSNCTITYNLWSENGNPSFLFHNKTNQGITVDKGASFFIMNGIAYDYFKNRVYTYSSTSANSLTVGSATSSGSANSTSNGLSNTNSVASGDLRSKAVVSTTGTSQSTMRINNSTTSNSKGYAVTYNEQQYIHIPAQSGKMISEYNISPVRFKHCDLQKNPADKSGLDSVVFTLENSPFVFSNIISYSLDSDTINVQKVVNKFFVQTILNMKENVFYYEDYEIGCEGKKSFNKVKFYKYLSPFNFYIRYQANLVEAVPSR